MTCEHSSLAGAGEPPAPLPMALPGGAGPDLPLVHPVYLRLLVAAARAEGIDLGHRLAALSLDPEALHGRDDPVPLVTWRHLLRSLQDQARGTGLAVRVGYQVPLLAHGPLAWLLACAHDMRQALEALVRFAPQRLAVLDLRLHVHANGIDLCAQPRVSLGDVERFTLDFLWGMLCRMIEDLCRGASRAMTLRLPAGRAEAARAWAQLGLAVGGSPAGMFLQLPPALVDAALPAAAAGEYQRAWRACEEAEREQGWSKSLGAQIEQLFRTGSAASYHLAWVAGRLGVSRRTVMRRLQAEGSQFSALVEASRKDRLLRRLTERQLTLGEIAIDLGYADGSAFSRAVQRWFGIGPRALQQAVAEGRHGAGDGSRAPEGLSPKINLLAPKD